jgi:simple sugar transport system ATP-binding protein
MLFERFTWEENLALGGFDAADGPFDLRRVAERSRRLAKELGFELPADSTTVERRSMAERVRLEVLRALSFNPRVLILDEPTSVLAPSELKPFLELLRRLRGEGRIVVLITHKLGEAMAVADRITVMRRGRVVETKVPSATDEAQLARMMIGEIVAQPTRLSARSALGDPVLAVESLGFESGGRKVLDGISFSLAAGEIAGIAGVDGNGQTELAELLAGVHQPSAGVIRVLGSASGGRTSDSDGITVIPQNRDLDGLILDMEIWENILLARQIRERVTSRGWLDRSRAIQLCADLIAQFRIRAGGPNVTAGALSGGNRQRLEVARAIATGPRAIVAHNICRGLDLAATAEVHRTILEFAAAGGAVLLLSSDLEELLALCGRLMVISGGKIRQTDPNERDPERLGLMMAGVAG